MLQLFFFAITLAVIVCPKAEAASPLEQKFLFKRNDNIKVCGRMLTQTLAILCEGEYYHPKENSSRTYRPQKRNYGTEPIEIDSYPQWLLLSLMSKGQLDSSLLSLLRPWMVKSQLEASQAYPEPSAFHKRKPRGVVDECCKKPCTFRELVSYCRNPVNWEERIINVTADRERDEE
ncbi:LIRP-like [Stegodyphus dumicola]|uniref:LIRP-like n=1 Tax=Stegodyphus dumicola TaxID=202533 RepID=UPI0015B0C031|nr:LIRP-like [Stegodyphus dumicola]